MLKKYIEFTFNLPSPFRSASLNISLTSSSVNLSPNEVNAFLNSTAFMHPSRSLSNTFIFSQILKFSYFNQIYKYVVTLKASPR